MLISCGPQSLFEATTPLPSTGWAYADTITFSYDIVDLDAEYDLVLDVTHSTEFPYQNFYVLLNTELPDGQRLEQPLSLQLANSFGEWLGDCSGKNCVQSVALQQNTRFTQAGPHRLIVRQHSRDNPLPEVEAVGLRVIPVPE